MIRGYPYFRKPPYSTLRGITWRRRCTQNFSMYIFWCHLDWIRGGVLLKSIQDLMPRNILGKYSWHCFLRLILCDFLTFPSVVGTCWHFTRDFFHEIEWFPSLYFSCSMMPKKDDLRNPENPMEIPWFHEPNQWIYRQHFRSNPLHGTMQVQTSLCRTLADSKSVQQNYETSNLGCGFCVNPILSHVWTSPNYALEKSMLWRSTQWTP